MKIVIEIETEERKEDGWAYEIAKKVTVDGIEFGTRTEEREDGQISKEWHGDFGQNIAVDVTTFYGK